MSEYPTCTPTQVAFLGPPEPTLHPVGPPAPLPGTASVTRGVNVFVETLSCVPMACSH